VIFSLVFVLIMDPFYQVRRAVWAVGPSPLPRFLSALERLEAPEVGVVHDPRPVVALDLGASYGVRRHDVTHGVGTPHSMASETPVNGCRR